MHISAKNSLQYLDRESKKKWPHLCEASHISASQNDMETLITYLKMNLHAELAYVPTMEINPSE